MYQRSYSYCIHLYVLFNNHLYFVLTCLSLEFEPEMSIAAKTLNSCLELLIPTPEEFSIPEVKPNESLSGSVGSQMTGQEESSDSDNEDDRRRETGIIDPAAHSVTVTLKPGMGVHLIQYHCSLKCNTV